jgi:hypothetical protein
VVNIVFVKKIEKIRELTDGRKDNSGKTQKENHEKLSRDPVFYGRFRMQKQRKTQARLFYELADIKAEEKRHGRVAYKNKEIAEAHHIPTRRACVSPENVGEGI